MSWRLAELFVMVPPVGALGRAQQQLEMNCLHCFTGRALKFMVKIILIMSCSSLTAFAVRTAAAQVNNINSYKKISHEAMHHINTLHYTSSNSYNYASFVPYKLNFACFAAATCTSTWCSGDMARALRSSMARSTALSTLLSPISTLTSPFLACVSAMYSVDQHACVVVAACVCIHERATLAIGVRISHQTLDGNPLAPFKLSELPTFTMSSRRSGELYSRECSNTSRCYSLIVQYV